MKLDAEILAYGNPCSFTERNMARTQTSLQRRTIYIFLPVETRVR
jgi:hypothetical protein